MNCRFRHLVACVAVLAALTGASSAAASGTDVLRACLNEQSLERFSDAEKRDALNQLAADQDEYSDCRSVIGASIGSKKVTASANPGAATAVAAKQGAAKASKATKQRARRAQAARRTRARKAREEKLGPRAVDPRDPGVFKAASTANGMPLPVLLAVIALALLSVSGGLFALTRRNPGVLRRVSLPRFRR